MPLPSKRVRVLISGQVQGVGFRWYCREEALERDLSGSVRNLPDGRVEAIFEGPSGKVDEMVAWCRSGPRGARVEATEAQEQPLAGEAGFSIEH